MSKDIQRIEEAVKQGSVSTRRPTQSARMPKKPETELETTSFKTPAASPGKQERHELGLTPAGKEEVKKRLAQTLALGVPMSKAEVKQIVKQSGDPKLVMEKQAKPLGDGIHGIKVIVIAPNAEDRFKRLQVLLGSHQAGNNVGLDEYTSILDSLLDEEKIDKKVYKRYLKIWHSKRSDDKM